MNHRCFDDAVIHEASHFIYYLIECQRNIRVPFVSELKVTPKNRKGHISVKHDMCVELSSLLIQSAAPGVEFHKRSIRGHIKYLLSGIAAEIINWGEACNAETYLAYFQKKDLNDNNSDLSKAVSFNVILGNQSMDEGATALLEILKETISDVSTFWPDIGKVATVLDAKKILRGSELEELINDFNIKHWNNNVTQNYIQT